MWKTAKVPEFLSNINVARFWDYLTKFNYPHIHILQYVEFGFPLGLWSNAYLEPSTKNHSSSYSYFSHVDKFVESELNKLGVTGPFDSAPWDDDHAEPNEDITQKNVIS